MRLRLLLVVCIAGAAIAVVRRPSLTAAEPSKAAPRLKVDFNAKGVSVLTYGTTNLLVDGAFLVERAVFRRPDGTEMTPALKPEIRWDARRRTLTSRFSWGSVTCEYLSEADRLRFHITVVNESPDVLQGLWLRPLLVRFPQLPKDWHPHGLQLTFLPGGPRVHVGDFGTGAVAFVNEDLTTPLISGFRWTSDPGKYIYPLVVWTSNFGWPDESVTQRMVRPIPSGGRDEYRLALRFGPSGPKATGLGLAADVYRKFATTYPYRLRWADRRPIGALFLSTSEPKLQSQTNPRGWLLDPKIDVTTPEGQAAFKQRMLHYAEASAALLKKTGAQGSIVWDVEGQQFPHMTSYLGDPRSLPPEMDTIADEFFARLRADGLRTGVTVRPQRPVRPAYGNGVFQIEVTDPAQNLIDKIAYAKKRWGCSLFYVDSNGAPSAPMDDDIMDRVAMAHPDVLLVPEHESHRYYSFSAPYHTLEMGIASTPSFVRDVYPDAFSVIYVPKDVAKHRAELVEAVRHGDILLIVGWHETGDTAEVRKIYEEAGRR
ncbi:MAG TPA: hypothetical protein VL371_22270 [Gemmataceae bacterium]|nr:hypothetical protein [Gemmataceae bacterium]